MLSDNCFPYRIHMSSTTCIKSVPPEISNAKNKKQDIAIAICEISKAYDYVNLHILCNKLNSKLSDICNGILQGCLLSPFLVNIYTANIHKLADTNTLIFQYADDFLFLSTGSSINKAVENLQNKLSHFKKKSK